MMRFLTPMRLFVVATTLPVFLIGAAALWGGVWVAFGLLYLTALTAVLDEMIHHATPATGSSEFPAADRLSIGLGVAHFALLGLVIGTLAHGQMGFAAKFALFLTAGLFFGQVSNSNAHELIHRGARPLRKLGMWMYISLLFGHHSSAHLLVHHRHVATPHDPSSARRGESYYRFAVGAWRGSFIKGLQAETKRLKTVNAPVYRNPYVTYCGGAFAFMVIAWLIGGGAGVLIYIALASFSTSQLLMSDYVQHYGLQRKEKDGSFEPVNVRHSWNSPHWFSSAVMLNAPRHADHHMHPTRPYPALRLSDDAPLLPRSLPVMACLALAPRRWKKVMDPLVAQWSAHD